MRAARSTPRDPAARAPLWRYDSPKRAMPEHRVNAGMIQRVVANVPFRVFAGVVGKRIRDGQSIDALRMLEGIGATGAIAHEIVEGWPHEGNVTPQARRLVNAGVPIGVVAACRLACFVDDLRNYDWPKMLLLGAVKAARGRSSDSAQVADAGEPTKGA